MNFFKYVATGNDFIVINQPFDTKTHSGEWVKRLCDRHYGVGADGLFFIWDNSGTWTWKFFNNDGSPANFCGNASRCALLWLSQQIDPKKMEWTWSDGTQNFKGHLTGKNSAEVLWPKSKLKNLELKSHVQAMVKQLHEIGLERALWVDAGVPHLVLMGSSWPRKIRQLFYSDHLTHHPDFIKQSNITWLSRTDMTLVSFERGVEAETLSCGSGALSAYYALKLRSEDEKNHKIPQSKIPTSITFQFPGGPLTISESEESLHLSGPVKKVFEGYCE